MLFWVEADEFEKKESSKEELKAEASRIFEFYIAGSILAHCSLLACPSVFTSRALFLRLVCSRCI